MLGGLICIFERDRELFDLAMDLSTHRGDMAVERLNVSGSGSSAVMATHLLATAGGKFSSSSTPTPSASASSATHRAAKSVFSIRSIVEEDEANGSTPSPPTTGTHFEFVVVEIILGDY